MRALKIVIVYGELVDEGTPSGLMSRFEHLLRRDVMVDCSSGFSTAARREAVEVVEKQLQHMAQYYDLLEEQ